MRFALTKGVQGLRPCKKKQCHPEERPQAYGDEGSRDASHLQEAARCLYGGV